MVIKGERLREQKNQIKIKMSTKFGQHIRIDHNSIFLKWKLDNPLKDALDKTML